MAVKPINVNKRLIFIQSFIMIKQKKEENVFIYSFYSIIYSKKKKKSKKSGWSLVDVLQGLHSNAEHKATADPN